MSADPVTVAELLRRQATIRPHAAAIQCLGEQAVSYSELAEWADEVGRSIRSAGMTERTSVGIRTTDPLHHAVLTLGAATTAIAVPISSTAPDAEVDTYLAATGASAVLSDTGTLEWVETGHPRPHRDGSVRPGLAWSGPAMGPS